MKRCSFCFAAALLLPSARGISQTAQQAVEDRVHVAIAEMDDDDFHKRQAGVKHMLDLPPEALVYLDRIISDNTESLEVIARVQGNVERLRAIARKNAKSRRAAQIAEWEATEAIKGYKASPSHDPRWDAAVNDGFSRITSIYDGGNPNTWRLYSPAVFEPFHKAVLAGCDDPLVNAYYLRTGFNTALLDSDSGRKVLPHVFPRIMTSSYAPALKLQAAIDFASGALFADPDGQLWTSTERWDALKTAADLWPSIVRDKTVPDVVLEELAGRLMDAASAADIGRLQIIGLLLDSWQTARPKTAAVFAFKAYGYLSSASTLLQDGTPRSDDEIKSLTDRIAIARDAGEKAYAADATDGWASTLLIQICRLNHPDRKEVELWFDRAMGADPENLDACMGKLDFLASNATSDEILKFGRECVARGVGQLPLALIRAHQLIANRIGGDAGTAYLKSLDVWNEQRDVFLKFLAAHTRDPMGLYYRSLYARDAAALEKWSIAQEQFTILGDHPHVGVFQSMSAYNYLRRKAERLTASH